MQESKIIYQTLYIPPFLICLGKPFGRLFLIWKWCWRYTLELFHLITKIELSIKCIFQQVVEQYLPESHAFLACIFMEIHWSSWFRSVSDNTPIHIKVKIQHCLLHLVVKLCNEPNIRNNHSDKAKALINEAVNFNWCFVEVSTYQQVLDWYVMSCDPLVIYKTDSSNLDCMVLR